MKSVQITHTLSMLKWFCCKTRSVITNGEPKSINTNQLLLLQTYSPTNYYKRAAQSITNDPIIHFKRNAQSITVVTEVYSKVNTTSVQVAKYTTSNHAL